MPQVAQIIGPAGTGKTTELLRLMELALERDIHDPHLIGFCSFTRAARREASSRAADRFDLKPTDLEQHGWFRTLHSVAYRCLGVGEELLTGNKADRDWLQESLQEAVDGQSTGIDQDLADPFAGRETDAGKALALWDAARNRLDSLDAQWQAAEESGDGVPDLDFCRMVVDRYEQAKRLDHRVDFTDLLSQFAGYYTSPDGAERCEPKGDAPDLPVWMFDESQDTSALSHAVAARLAGQPSVRWVYVAGDDAQCIYGWSGADPRWLRTGWPVAKRRVLPKSYRCPGNIMGLAEGLLRDCGDSDYYADRNVAGADHAGVIETERMDDLIDLLDPRESWLVLARTNYLAGRLAHRLDEADLPWLPTRGGGTWAAPVRTAAIAAMVSLASGAPIDGAEWQSVLKYLPAATPDGPLLERGTKKRFEAMTAEDAAEQFSWVQLDELADLGGTPLLIEGIRRGTWKRWVDGAERYTAAVAEWGQEAVDKPMIRVGTIHSVKGSEADNVALLTSIPKQCAAAARTPDGFDAETRVKYVGITRARKRLVLLNEAKPLARWKLEV